MIMRLADWIIDDSCIFLGGGEVAHRLIGRVEDTELYFYRCTYFVLAYRHQNM